MSSIASQYYLNDVVINHFFKLITKRDPRVYCFDTYFLTKWKKSEYEGVKRWTKNVDIFSKTKIFFPINIQIKQFVHWVLVCVDNVQKRITYYDSLPKRACFGVTVSISDYLKAEHEAKLGVPADQYTRLKSDNPYQENGQDCGVFVCTFAEYLSRNMEFNFDQSHMPSFRQLILFELNHEMLFDLCVENSEIDDTIQRIIDEKSSNV